MHQLSSASRFRALVSPERFRTPVGQRALAIALALALEALLLILLLSLGLREEVTGEASDITVVDLKAHDVAAEGPVEDRPEPSPAQDEQPVLPPQPTPDTPPAPRPPEPEPAPQPVAPVSPAPRAVVPTPREVPSAAVYPRPIQSPVPGRPVAGPANRGGAASGDSARVGTAPNGEPLYAAAWYREPAEDELRGYLSTASGPGWGLIACRTAPDFRVEDCVGLAEYPQGSQINRAVLAAAWQFKVRPPRLGGRPQIGSWVRIRIDYGTARRAAGP